MVQLGFENPERSRSLLLELKKLYYKTIVAS